LKAAHLFTLQAAQEAPARAPPQDGLIAVRIDDEWFLFARAAPGPRPLRPAQVAFPSLSASLGQHPYPRGRRL